MISTLLFDLDGVIRHFEPGVTAMIERRHGLTPGAIPQIAFTGASIEQLTTGRLRRADWITAIGETLGNRAAAQEWGEQRAWVDPAMLALAGELVAAGIRTAILTNGSDTIPAETAELRLDGRFDPVFNAAEIGFAKPDARAYAHVLDALGCAPDRVLFTDDSRVNIEAPAELGVHTHHFQDAASLREDLEARGVLPGT